MAAPVVESYTEAGTYGTSLTINAPTGITAGDFLLVFYSNREDVTLTDTPADAGFTELFVLQSNNNDTGGVWYKVADGTEGSVTISHGGNTHHMSGIYARVSGTSGIDDWNAQATGFGSSPTIQSATASADDTLQIAGVLVNADPPYTDPAGFTREWYTYRNGSSVYTLSRTVNTGATGLTGIDAGENQVFYTYNILLAPADTGPAVVEGNSGNFNFTGSNLRLETPQGDPTVANSFKDNIILWDDFNATSGTDLTNLGYTVEGGAGLLEVDLGMVTDGGAGTAQLFTKDLGEVPSRIEAHFDSYDITGSRGALVFRYADADNFMMIRQSISANTFQFYIREAGSFTKVAEVPLTHGTNADWFPCWIVVEDDGTDVVMTHKDLGLTIRASDYPAFTNQFSTATSIGGRDIGTGANASRMRFLKAWRSYPTWNNTSDVEPQFGALHIWTKFHARHVGIYDRTYYGWIGQDAKVYLRYYDHDTKSFSDPEVVFNYNLDLDIQYRYDDHHVPGVYVHDDGRVFVWIQSHKSSDFLLYRSTNPEDITAWDSAIDMNTQTGSPGDGVYPRAYRVSNGDILLFHRVGGSADGEWHMRRSTDDGATWDNTKIIDNTEGHVYQFVRQDPNDPDHLVLVGNHKDTATEPDSWRRIYVWETNDGGVSFEHLTTNTSVALPASRTDLEGVTTAGTYKEFVSGAAITTDGNVRIISHEKDDPDHEIVEYHYNGSSWQRVVITASETWPNESTYTQDVFRPAGGEVNPDNPNEVAISVKNGTSVHEIQRWTTSDGGATWSKSEDVTSNSERPNFRPYYVENANSDWNLFWQSGNFYGVTDKPNGAGNAFDRFDDVMVVNELLVNQPEARTGSSIHIPVVSTTEPQPVGSYSLSGTNSALYRNLKVNAGSDGYFYSGSNLTLNTRYQRDLDSGSLSLTGSDSRLLVTIPGGVDAGSYSLSGTPLGTIRQYRVGALSGSLSLSGVTLGTRMDGEIALERGNLTLSGNDLAVYRNTLVDLPSDSYQLFGAQVGLFKNSNLGINSGTFSYSGVELKVKFNASDGSLDAGTFTLTGPQPNFSRELLIKAKKSTYTLSGELTSLTELGAATIDLTRVVRVGPVNNTVYVRSI